MVAAKVGDYETVTVEGTDGVTTVTFDRPEKKNAMNPLLHEEMFAVVDAAKEDALDPEGGTDVLVLTGAGDSFCAGQDLEEFFFENRDDPEASERASELAMEWARELRTFPRLTIAAVNGWCIGGGLRICGTCDLAIASERAKFGLSEVNFGKFPAGGTTRVLSRLLAPRDFLYLSLTGEPVDAEEAELMRLVNRTVPHDELHDEVMSLAGAVSDKNQLAIRFAKEVYRTEVEENISYDHALDYERARSRLLSRMQSAEEMDAIEAFSEGKFRPGVESYDLEDIGR